MLTRSFKYRDFRLFFGGQCISLMGTWIQRVALSWMVYRLTGSAALMGIVSFMGDIPTFFLSPFAGVWADRWSRRKALVVVQSLLMIQAFILAFTVLFFEIQVWQIILYGFLQGVISAFDIPLRQSFVGDMIPKKDDLGNAIGLHSSLFNSARIVGPSIAGILIAIVGEGMCFLINALSYIPVIMALCAITAESTRKNKKEVRLKEDLTEGFIYAYSFTPIKYALFLLSIVSLLGMPYIMLMPIFAAETLQGGAQTLGLLMGFSGMGALVGAISLAVSENNLSLARRIPLATLIFGSALILFSLSKILLFSFFMMFLVGLGGILTTASINTLLQTVAEEDKRGRIMSLYTMSYRGMTPFGNLLAGFEATNISAPRTLIIAGFLCIAGALVYLKKMPLLRTIIKERVFPEE